MTARASVVALCEMIQGQESDLFALLTVKELLQTRDGKPYHRVGFRDARREVSFPIWQDSPWAEECKQAWTPGVCYKLRAVYRETNFGPQLEIRKIRPVTEADRADGYDPQMFLPRSRFDAVQMFADLTALVETKVDDSSLRRLTQSILSENRERLLALPAATRNHHAYVAGWLEHTIRKSEHHFYRERPASRSPCRRPETRRRAA